MDHQAGSISPSDKKDEGTVITFKATHLRSYIIVTEGCAQSSHVSFFLLSVVILPQFFTATRQHRGFRGQTKATKNAQDLFTGRFASSLANKAACSNKAVVTIDNLDCVTDRAQNDIDLVHRTLGEASGLQKQSEARATYIREPTRLRSR